MKEERTAVLATGLINEAYCQRTVTYNGKEFEILVDSTGSVVEDPTEITRLCNNGTALREYTETGKIPEWYKLGE